MRINPKHVAACVLLVLVAVAVWLLWPRGTTPVQSRPVATSSLAPTSPSPTATASADPTNSAAAKAALNARVKKFAVLYLSFSPERCDRPQILLQAIRPYVTDSFYDSAARDDIGDSQAGKSMCAEKSTIAVSDVSDLLGGISGTTASGYITYTSTKYTSAGDELYTLDDARKPMTWVLVKGTWYLDSLTN